MRGCHAAPRAAHRAPLLALFAGVGRQRLNNGSTDRKGHWRASGPSLMGQGPGTKWSSLPLEIRSSNFEIRNKFKIPIPNQPKMARFEFSIWDI